MSTSTAAGKTNSTAATPPDHPVFVTTHWSLVLSARNKDSPQSADALEKLCRAYWYPIYAYARRLGHRPQDAEDLTQEFFARLLARNYLEAADREKGRFRTFLLTAVKRFLAKEWRRVHAQKRGGFLPVISIDQQLAESRFVSEPADPLQPDVLFERQWAMTLLERTLARLREEYTASGRARLFELLQAGLTRDETALAYADIAKGLNLTEAAIKVAAYRLRLRYREILRAEIADTVAQPGEVEDELRHLFSVFGS